MKEIKNKPETEYGSRNILSSSSNYGLDRLANDSYLSIPNFTLGYVPRFEEMYGQNPEDLLSRLETERLGGMRDPLYLGLNESMPAYQGRDIGMGSQTPVIIINYILPDEYTKRDSSKDWKN